MKILTGILVTIFVFAFLLAPNGDAAGLEPFGKVSILGGAEREGGAPAGGRGAIEFLGVAPFTQNFGVQGTGHYVGGRGSRYGLNAGPIFSWDTGKAGVLVNYQHRTLGDNNFVHIRPSLGLYFDQANVNLWYSHPVSEPQRDRRGVEYGINRLQGTVSYFPPMDVATFMRKDNLEVTLGVQVNTFAGAGRSKLEGAGVGPVLGVSFMPTQNVEVNLFKATIDNRSRYRVYSGLQFFFNRTKDTLKELRRKYLQPANNFEDGGGVGRVGPPPPPTT